MDPDLLYTVKNQFWVGNFADAVREAESVRTADDSVRIERDFYRMRAEVELGTGCVNASGVDDALPTALQAVQLYAAHRNGSMPEADAVARLKAWMDDENINANPMLVVMAATVYNRLGDWRAALTALKDGTTIEQLALRVQILVQINRLDKAQVELKRMREIDDDATLTELAKGWVYCRLGSAENMEQALYAFQELGGRFGRTAPVLNNIASCHIGLSNYEEADRCLEEAFEGDMATPETYINAIVSARHQQKPEEVVQALLDTLRAKAPTHPWVLQLDQLSEEFDRCAAEYKDADKGGRAGGGKN